MLPPDMSKRLDLYFADYATHHRTAGNQLTHYVGIPLITLSLFGLLAGIPVLPSHVPAGEVLRLDGGTLLLALATLWYLVIDWRLAIPFALFAAGLYFFGRALPAAALTALFVAGWVLQGVGHYVYEKRSPAFFTHVRHLLIGPLWIFARWVGYVKDDESGFPRESHDLLG
jgi:uncharacterized membrane protein YGL010W